MEVRGRDLAISLVAGLIVLGVLLPSLLLTSRPQGGRERAHTEDPSQETGGTGTGGGRGDLGGEITSSSSSSSTGLWPANPRLVAVQALKVEARSHVLIVPHQSL